MPSSNNSELMFRQACQLLPGGVDSPVRAFGAVGGHPLFMARGSGSKIYDVDGNEYIDYVCSWGPLILGHASPGVIAGLTRVIGEGTSFGAPTEREVILAGLVVEALPAMDRVRFVNSGTEAAMSAIRVARAFTGRKKIIKFAGGYHGHADSFLVQAGSGALTLGMPSSPGVPPEIGGLTIVLPYNSLAAVEDALQRWGDDVAAVIVEPVAANMGVVPPAPGWLAGLRQLTMSSGCLLIFDEVITGFRIAYGGAQSLYGVAPDLTCLGKIIGGGLPVGAYGGRADVMKLVAPEGPVYQAGTLSGNPAAMQAGIETLKQLQQAGVYEQLEEKGSYLESGLQEAAAAAGIPVSINRVGSLLSLFFCGNPVRDLDSALAADQDRFAQYFHSMLSQGIYLPPSQFESLFISLVHSRSDLDRTMDAARQALEKMRQ